WQSPTPDHLRSGAGAGERRIGSRSPRGMRGLGFAAISGVLTAGTGLGWRALGERTESDVKPGQAGAAPVASTANPTTDTAPTPSSVPDAIPPAPPPTTTPPPSPPAAATKASPKRAQPAHFAAIRCSLRRRRAHLHAQRPARRQRRTDPGVTCRF